MFVVSVMLCFFFFQAEDGIRDLVRSRGLGDVYKRQVTSMDGTRLCGGRSLMKKFGCPSAVTSLTGFMMICLLYTSDAADERSSVDLGGRRIIKKQKRSNKSSSCRVIKKVSKSISHLDVNSKCNEQKSAH